MLNKTKLFLKANTTIELAKSLFADIGERLEVSQARAESKVENMVPVYEEKIRQNDFEVLALEEKISALDEEILYASRETEMQRKRMEMELRILNELEAKEKGIRYSKKSIEEKIQKKISQTNNLQQKYNKLLRDLAAIESEENANRVIKIGRKNKKVIEEPVQKEKEYGACLNRKDVARALRLKMHEMSEIYDQEEPVKRYLKKGEEEGYLSYQYRDRFLKDGEWIECEYFFTTSLDKEEDEIILHTTQNGRKVHMANGEDVFIPFSDDLNEKEELNLHAKYALRNLVVWEAELDEKYEKRQENQYEAELLSDEGVLLKKVN